MKKFIIFLFSVFLLTSSVAALAETIDFEDLWTGTEDMGLLPSDYAGFSWNENTYYMTKYFHFPTVTDMGGYFNGTVGNVKIASAFATEPISVSNSDYNFNFTGAYITSSWMNGQDIFVEGWRDGSMAYSTSVITDTTQPNWFDFNFNDIDTLIFRAGTEGSDAGYGNVGHNFVLDNLQLTATPEPLGSVLFLLGGSSIAILRRRRKNS